MSITNLRAETQKKNIRMTVHALTDCVMLKSEKQIKQLAKFCSYLLYGNDLARLFSNVTVKTYVGPNTFITPFAQGKKNLNQHALCACVGN